MRTSCAVRGTVGRVKVKLGRPTPPVPGELGVEEMDQRSGWKREPPGAGHHLRALRGEGGPQRNRNRFGKENMNTLPES